MNKRNFKALLAVLLTVVMVFSIVPMSVSAADATYTMIDKVADLTAGTYKMAGYTDAYQVWNGQVSSSDLVTSSYTYADGVLTATGTADAADIALVAVDGKANTYYIKSGSKYLYSTSSANRKLALGDTATEWVAADNSKGGITLTTTVGDAEVNLGTNGTASSRFLRSYGKLDTLTYGVVFFAAEGGSEGGDGEEETPVVVPATLAEQIAAANALANGAYLPYESTITGTITNDPKASSYTAGAYDFTVSDGTNSVRCYYVPVTGGTPAKGDTVTVTGKLTAYDGSAQFDSTAVATWVKGAEGGEEPETPTVTFPFADGDSFAIYYPASGTVIGTLPSGAKLSAVEATLANGKITRESGMAEFTADFITDTVFCLIVDGKYLTSGATGNSLSLADEISDYAGWTLEAAENGWYIKNANAAYNGNAQYIEFYSGFTTYGLNTSKADIYTFNFYALEGTVEEEEVVIYETPEEIVDAAYGLEDGQILSAGHKYTLTGVITSVDTAYDSSYKNVTVTIVVGGMTDKPIKVYRVKGEGADVIKVGDTITVTGVIKNYMGTIEFDQGCTLDSYTPATPDPVDPPQTGDAMIVLVSVVLLAGAALVVVSRKRRFN